jgi:APA family basic amino acid/polyamine antiporter
MRSLDSIRQFLSHYTWHALIRKKSLKNFEESTSRLQRRLKWYDITGYGLGTTIGAGIFVVSGKVAHDFTGPSIIISFLLAGLISLITGFCYGEFASRIPASGSAYAYTYTSLGEFVGWFVGWNLTLEYGIASAVVASAWSSNLVTFFRAVGVTIPNGLYNIETSLSWIVINPLSLVIVVACTIILTMGIKLSALANNIMTILNITIILFVIIAGSFYVNPKNWKDFVPFGASGIIQGTAVVFFSYVGFDSVTALAGEALNPRRDMPIAIILTVTITTCLYIFAGLIITGMVKYSEIDRMDAPLANAFISNGANWAAIFVAIGSVTTMSSTMLCSMLGQPRIYLSMAEDGLLFSWFQKLHGKAVPLNGTLVTAVLAGVLALFLRLENLADMISLGTLAAFTVVCVGVILLRVQKDNYTPRPILFSTIILLIGCFISWIIIHFYPIWYIILPVVLVAIVVPFLCVLYLYYIHPKPSILMGFTCPFLPITPCLGIIFNTYFLSQLSKTAFTYFACWTGLGLIIYFSYGIRHSLLNIGRRSFMLEDYGKASSIISIQHPEALEQFSSPHMGKTKSASSEEFPESMQEG